jgi:hypothetical protein
LGGHRGSNRARDAHGLQATVKKLTVAQQLGNQRASRKIRAGFRRTRTHGLVLYCRAWLRWCLPVRALELRSQGCTARAGVTPNAAERARRTLLRERRRRAWICNSLTTWVSAVPEFSFAGQVLMPGESVLAARRCSGAMRRSLARDSAAAARSGA